MSSIPSSGQLRVGTSGYSYKEWKGNFYPDKLPDREMLSFYAKQFSTVEINHSFYRMPTESALLNWAKSVPEGFRFSLKVNQQITHIHRNNSNYKTLTPSEVNHCNTKHLFSLIFLINNMRYKVVITTYHVKKV